MEPIFSVPIVFQDASDNDVFADIVAAVERLDMITDAVFTRIENRVDEQHKQITALKHRVEDCKFKVDQVEKQSSKAVTVFAPSKHPFTEQFTPTQSYRSLFADLRTSTLPEDIDDAGICAMRRYELCDSSESNYPSSSLAVAEIAETLLACRSETRETEEGMEGLGPLPKGVCSMASTVVFNTRMNPYEAYDTVDNLASTDNEVANEKRRKEQEELEEKKLLSEAPVSIREGDAMPELAEYEIGFRPQLKEMEALTLPSNLSLPDIANISFDQELKHKSIAPSLHNADTASAPRILDMPKPDSASHIPPPAPVHFPTPVRTHEDASQTQTQPVVVAPPPPPPPKSPPPPSVAMPMVSTQAKNIGSTAPTKIAAGGGRGDLLSAIRDKGNIARLKSVSEDSPGHVTESVAIQDEESLSFAEEMKIKLKRRQKALRGQSAEEEELERERRERRRELNAPLHAVRVVGKLKAKAGLFDLQNVSGIDDLLSARAAAAPARENRSHSPSLFSDESDDWDDE